MAEIELILIRHGLTEENAMGIIQGHMPGTLTKVGRKHAEAVGMFLADYILQGSKADFIFSSDLARSRDSAEIIAKQLGLSLIQEPLLRERSYGEMQGTHFPEGFDDDLADTDNVLFQGKKVESFQSLRQRANAVIEKIRALKLVHGKVVAVGHANMNNFILNYLFGNDFGKISFKQRHGDIFRIILDAKGRVKHAETYRIRFDSEGNAVEVKKQEKLSKNSQTDFQAIDPSTLRKTKEEVKV